VSENPDGTLVELDQNECYTLMSTQAIGRLAVAAPGEAPLVVPVNFVLDGEVIVFRSDVGTKIRLLRQGPVAFEVDFIDWHHRTGWSVLARGVAYEATAREVEHLNLEPWVTGEKRDWIRIVVSEVTGRRLDRIDLPWARNPSGYL
jgi:nitroimidazol reductase NimA-like FMN-containing flavoprotein (pyridoxamine 5'-phosphate oxidase superfamily)